MQNRINDLLREQSYVLEQKFVGDVAVIVLEFVEAQKAIREGRGTERHASVLNDFHTHLVNRVREELAAMSRSE